MLIAVCSDKGSPGVTTSALALAAAWSAPAVVVEADPSGGDLAMRIRASKAALPETPTVLTVATAARSNHERDLLDRHTHRLNKNVSVIPAPILREQMAGVRDWELLSTALARCTQPVFADLGHLHSAAKAAAVAAQADLVIAVARPTATSVIRLRERLRRLGPDLGALRGCPPRLFPLLIASSRHGEAAVTDIQSILADTPAKPFVVGGGFLALDPSAVRRLETGEEPAGRLARTALMRSARSVVDQIGPIAATTPRVPDRQAASRSSR
jgi:hypothetical protein